MSDCIGLNVATYEITERIGSGTAADSYLARDQRGKLAVAKRLHDVFAQKEETWKRFLDATELSSRIRMKRFLATVISQSRSGDGSFLIREFIPGKSLAEHLSNNTLKDLDCQRIAIDLCDAVRAMAQRDVVHGMLHPGNLIITEDGRVKVTDYGIGSLTLTHRPQRLTANILRFCAPEVLQGQPATAVSDIYSVGLILWLLQNQKMPFGDDAGDELPKRIAKGETSTDPAIAAAIVPNPARRLSTIDKLRDLLLARERAQGSTTTQTPPDKKEEPQTRPQPQNRAEDRKPTRETSTPGGSQKETPQTRKEPPKTTQPQNTSVPERPNATTKHGTLSAIHDVTGQRRLAASPAEGPWMISKSTADVFKPLQLVNGGTGVLELSIRCNGAGISANFEQVSIAPNQMYPILLRLASNSDTFVNVVFEWKENNVNKVEVIKIFRN